MKRWKEIYLILSCKGGSIDSDVLGKMSPMMRTLMVAPKKADKWSVIWDVEVNFSLKELATTLVSMGFPEGYVTQDKKQILWAKSDP